MWPSYACKAKPVRYVVKWDSSSGSGLDGDYVEAGTWNGKPKFKQRNGPGVIFYEGFLRKLPDGEGTPGWKLGIEERESNHQWQAVKHGSAKDAVPPEGKYWMYGRQHPWILKRKVPA
ncbi:PDZRN4 [Symbiodinium sp. CCMP2456]|nr:PDZRN4 [Symbiodinium sp. CCMP2456]